MRFYRMSAVFRVIRLGAVVLGAVSLSVGCEDRATGGTITPPKRPPKSDRAGNTDALDAAIAEQAGYSYTPQGKRDPFRSFIAVESDGPDLEQLGPLQKFELDEYQLVGIITGTDRPLALVEDPEGVGHVMERGTYIGRNWGKVTQINPEYVVVTEEYQTIDGDLSVDTIQMRLPSEEDL